MADPPSLKTNMSKQRTASMLIKFSLTLSFCVLFTCVSGTILYSFAFLYFIQEGLPNYRYETCTSSFKSLHVLDYMQHMAPTTFCGIYMLLTTVNSHYVIGRVSEEVFHVNSNMFVRILTCDKPTLPGTTIKMKTDHCQLWLYFVIDPFLMAKASFTSIAVIFSIDQT